MGHRKQWIVLESSEMVAPKQRAGSPPCDRHRHQELGTSRHLLITPTSCRVIPHPGKCPVEIMGNHSLF